jgi:hypothetical protein
VTQTFTDTPEQRDAFKRAAILRLDGLLSAEGVSRAREAVLRPLEQLGLWKAGAWHLDALAFWYGTASGAELSKR